MRILQRLKMLIMLTLWLACIAGTIVTIFAWKLFPGINPLAIAICGTFFARGIGRLPRHIFDGPSAALPRYTKYVLAPDRSVRLSGSHRALITHGQRERA